MGYLVELQVRLIVKTAHQVFECFVLYYLTLHAMGYQVELHVLLIVRDSPPSFQMFCIT